MNDKTSEFKTIVRQKENHISMLKSKNQELEKDSKDLAARIMDMRVKERENEQLKAQLSKRENQLAMKTIEADKYVSLCDKKNAEINKLNRELRQLKTGGGDDVAVYHLKEEGEKVGSV